MFQGHHEGSGSKNVWQVDYTEKVPAIGLLVKRDFSFKIIRKLLLNEKCTILIFKCPQKSP